MSAPRCRRRRAVRLFVVASRRRVAETGLPSRGACAFVHDAPVLHEHDRRLPVPVRLHQFARMREASERPRSAWSATVSDEAHALLAGLEGILAERAEGNPLVVSHGTVLALYVARATRVDAYALWLGLRYPCLVALSVPDRRLTGTWNVEAPSPPPA
jgi:broad specificity phosphatase PhoE